MGLKEGLVECATVCVKSEVILGDKSLQNKAASKKNACRRTDSTRKKTASQKNFACTSEFDSVSEHIFKPFNLLKNGRTIGTTGLKKVLKNTSPLRLLNILYLVYVLTKITLLFFSNF